MTLVRAPLTAVASVLVLAACGSSGTPSGAADKSYSQALAFSRCMRSHGVSNFPDPSPGGDLGFAPGSGVNPQSPAFQSAQTSCRRLLPNKGAPPHMTASERQAAVKFADCMRGHGQPNFPDPSDASPSSTRAVLVLRGMTFAVGPGLDPKSPAFRRAAQRCGIKLPGGNQPRGIG